MTNTTALVLALDMGDGPTLRRMAAAGQLPNFARWFDKGRFTELTSPARQLHTSAWPSFATGRSPGGHGIYFPLQPREGRQGPVAVDRSQLRAPCFWQRPDLAGHCLVVDLPETFADTQAQTDGIHDWGTWAHYGATRSQPVSLLKELRLRHGDYPLPWEATRLGLKIPPRERLTQELERALEHKARVYTDLLRTRSDRLAIFGFAELHAAGHYLWDDGPRLSRVYRALDRVLGDLSKQRAPGSRLSIISVDGCRSNSPYWHWLPDCLEHFGYNGSNEQIPSPRRRGAIGLAKSLVSASARRWIADRLPARVREAISARDLAERTDWANTRAYCLPTDLEGYIRINLEGREPEGIVTHEAFDSTCRQIKADLESLHDRDSGMPVVDEVVFTHEAFSGQGLPQLPDIIVTWRQTPAKAITSPRWPAHATPLDTPAPDRRPGTHGTEGFLLEAEATSMPAPTQVTDLGSYLLAQIGQHAESPACTN